MTCNSPSIHRSSRARLCADVALVLSSLLSAGTLAAQSDRICFPPHRGLPYLYLAPTVDGFVEPEFARTVDPAKRIIETGWTRSPRVTYVSSAAEPMVSFQGLKHNAGDTLFLSFRVQYDPTFDDEDAIVLVFKPTWPALAKDGSERRIDIYPVLKDVGANQTGYLDPNDDNLATPGDPNTAKLRTNRNPQGVTYSRWDTGASQWLPLTLTAAGAGANEIKSSSFTDNIKVRSWDPGGANNKNWFVEIKIPTSKVAGGTGWMDIASDFGFYYNVLRACSVAIASCNSPSQGTPSNVTGNAMIEFAWPRADYATGDRLIQEPTGTKTLIQFEIPVSWLGQATLGSSTSCTGVHFETEFSSIGVQNAAAPNGPLGTDIDRSAVNKMAARIVNDGTAAATNVSAEFLIADWGINGANAQLGGWNTITAPGTINPVSGLSVATGGARTTALMDWQLTPQQKIDYPQYKHMCVAVRLTSTSNVIFSQSQAWNNLRFVGMSKQSLDASVSGQGFPKGPIAGKQYMLLVASEFRMSANTTYNSWVPGKDDYNRSVLMREPLAIGAVSSRQNVQPPPNPTEAAIQLRWLQAGQGVTSSTVWIVNGYRATPFTLNIRGKKFRVFDPANSFGVVGEHAGETKDFVGDIAGQTSGQVAALTSAAGLREERVNSWQVEVPDGGKVQIRANLQASDTTIVTQPPDKDGHGPCPRNPFGSLSVVGGLALLGVGTTRRRRQRGTELSDSAPAEPLE